MAGNAGVYAVVYCAVEGALLTEHASATMKRMTMAQEQATVAKGWAGVSPGAKKCTIEVKNAVPSKDFELDAGPFMKAYKLVEISLVGPGGKRATSKGFIVEDSITQSVNSPAEYDFSFVGIYPDWVQGTPAP